MYLYYSLLGLASLFGNVAGEFRDLGNSISGVWLIGQYLSTWFYSIAGVFSTLQGEANDAAREWYGFYNWIINNLEIDERIAQLLRYADDLLSFIRYPFDWISDTLQDNFPELFRIARDPISWVLETIYRYTGLTIDFLDNPFRAVREWILDIAGDAIEIAKDPYSWLLNWLSDIIPDGWNFIFDARMWVRRKIEEEFPDLILFLRDPDDFLEDKILAFFDKLTSKYRKRVIAITEKILDIIF